MRHFFSLAAVVVLLGAYGCTKKEKPVIRFSDVEITEAEFARAYQASPLFGQGKIGLQVFLDQYITKKILLREAERVGLNKDPRFLSDIQQYWEKDLMTLALSKARGQLPEVVVSEKDIEGYYSQNKDILFAGKDLNDVRGSIKNVLTRQRQAETLSRLIESIRRNTVVEIDHQRLGI